MGYLSIGYTLLIMIPVAASLAFPLFSKRSQEAETRATIQQLLQACTAYHAEYGRFPYDDLNPVDRELSIRDAISVFQNRDITQNRKRIVFYEPAANQTVSGDLVDPWKTPYHVMVDGDGDGKISTFVVPVQQRVLVWSYGPNKQNDYGTGDDIASWR